MIDEFEGIVVAEKYKIDSLLREGESGDLYFARHIFMDKQVTVKILAPALAVDKRAVKRFSDEARAASAVTHANILNITDFGTDAAGVEYAIYEGVDGETLKDALRRDGSLSVERALTLAKQIANALATAHAKQIIHGHVDPRHVFLNKAEDFTETAKVFGIGSVEGPKSMNAQYMAPEQSLRPLVADERTDIYSVGVILYQMLAGELPYNGENAADVLEKQNNELPPPLVAFRQDIPADLEPMILSAMSKDPERRYQTMSAFAEDLELLSKGIGAPTVKAAAAAAAGDAPKRNLWQTAAIVLAGILVLGLALIFATSGRQTNPTLEMRADVGSLPVQPINPATGAQEESLSKLPPMTEAEITAAAASPTATTPGSDLPGGDQYNPWANGGKPPPGAPLQNNFPQGAQNVTIDPNGSSPFMPSSEIPPGCSMLPSGIVLCPKPLVPDTTAKPSPTPKSNAANANTATLPGVKPTPKPMATPPANAAVPKKPATKPPTNKPSEEEKQ